MFYAKRSNNIKHIVFQMEGFRKKSLFYSFNINIYTIYMNFNTFSIQYFYLCLYLNFKQTYHKFSQHCQNTRFEKVIYRKRCSTAILSKSTPTLWHAYKRRRRGIIRSHRFLSRCLENEKLKGWVNDMRSCRVVSTGTISQFLTILFLVLHSHPKAIVPLRCFHLFLGIRIRVLRLSRW